MKEIRINQRTNNLIGKNIKKLRVQQHLRNVDMVAKLQLEGISVNSSTFSKIESGISNPGVELLLALTRILGCDVNALFAIE